MKPRPAWIAVVGPSPESRGGIARVIAQVSKIELPAEGPRLVLVTSFRGGGTPAKVGSWLRGWTRFAVLCTLRRPTLSYVHLSSGASTFRKATFIALSRAAGVPVLLHVHPATFFDQLVRPGIAGGVARRCLRAAVAVIVLSESFVDDVHAIDPEIVVHVVANAPDVDESCPADPPGGRVSGRILFVGSFVDDKGVDVLVEAAARVAVDIPGLCLALAGSGADEPELRASVARGALAGRTEFLGWLRDRSLDLEYARASLFILPSRTEGLPLALLEAMWHGVPCVATTVGAVPELLADGAGALVPPEDVGTLADTIRVLLEDSTRAEALGAEGAERVRARYAPSRQRRSIGQLLLRYAGAPASAQPAHPRAGHAVDTTTQGAPRQ